MQRVASADYTAMRFLLRADHLGTEISASWAYAT